MVETAAAAPPRPATPAPAAPSGAKPAEAPAPAPTWKYKAAQPSPKFSLDHLLTNGYVELTLILNATLKATFRSLSVDSLQDVEQCFHAQDKEHSYKWVSNEMSITQIYHSLVSVNDRAMPPASPARGKAEYDPAKDPRMAQVRNMPGALFDTLILGMSEFEARAKALVGGESLANF